MEAEEGERAATQRVYDQAQCDYSAQVLGDRAHGLPEEPLIGSIGPLPTQRFLFGGLVPAPAFATPENGGLRARGFEP